MKFYSAYRRERPAGLSFGVADSRTKQSFKDDCDIRVIARRFGLTGQLPENLAVPQYGDFTGAPADFQTAMQVVLDGRATFMQLPASVRKRFGNDPGAFMEFVHDEKNYDEALKLGVSVKSLPARDVVTAVDELAAALKKE